MPLKSSGVMIRASAGFILDQVRLGRGPLDLLDALILMAISQANVQPVMRDLALETRYAAYEQAPPDDLRRPISVNAAAQSLGVPFETVRRRVASLAKARLCTVVDGGVVVPTPVVRLGSHKVTAEANYERTRALHQRLAGLGLAPQAARTPPWSGAVPVRAVARIAADYLLRLISSATGELGEVVSMTIWLEILRSTHEDLADELGVRPELSSPVSVSAVARRIGLPTENVRRRVAEYAERGLCERTRDGVRLGPETVRRPELLRILRDNHLHMNRMFAALSRLGIAQMWQADAEALGAR